MKRSAALGVVSAALILALAVRLATRDAPDATTVDAPAEPSATAGTEAAAPLAGDARESPAVGTERAVAVADDAGADDMAAAGTDGSLRLVATVRAGGAVLREIELDARLLFRNGYGHTDVNTAIRSGIGVGNELMATHEAVLTTDAEGRVAWSAALPDQPVPDGRSLDLQLVLRCDTPPARGGQPRLWFEPHVEDGVLDLGVLDLDLAELVARGRVVDPEDRPLAGARVGPARIEQRDGDGSDLTTRTDADGRFELRSVRQRPPRSVVALLDGYTCEPVPRPRDGSPVTLVMWPAEPLRGVVVLPETEAVFELEVQAIALDDGGDPVVVDRAPVHESGWFELTGGALFAEPRLRLGGSSALDGDLLLEYAGPAVDASGRPGGRYLLPADCRTCEVDAFDADGVPLVSFVLEPHGTLRQPIDGTLQLYVLSGDRWWGGVRTPMPREYGYAEIAAPRATVRPEPPFLVEFDVRLVDPELAGAEVDHARIRPEAPFGDEPLAVVGVLMDSPRPAVLVPRDGAWRIELVLEREAADGSTETLRREVGPIVLRRGESPVVVEL